jgi:hypothetical protein
MEPLTIELSFDVGQVVPGGIAGFVASLVHEFRFSECRSSFRSVRCPNNSLPAQGLNHPRRTENLAVIGGGVLAAAIGIVSEAGRRLLPLDGQWSGLRW